jgi:hypothetical protein
VILKVFITFLIMSNCWIALANKSKSTAKLHAGTGFPNITQVGVSRGQKRGWEYGIKGGYFKKDAGSRGRTRNINISHSHIEFFFKNQIRGHPVYWELGLGYQEIIMTSILSATLKTGDIEAELPIHARAKIAAIFISPKIGFNWRTSRRISMGFGFGYQIPITSKGSFDANYQEDPFINDAIKSTQSYRNMKHEAGELATKAGKLGLPVIEVFNINYEI